MTTEAVYGYEMITFNQADADVAPAHMVMSAFARNAFDPMDFTPVSLHKIPRINRVTTPAFELGTSVIFLSGIQHYVEGPEGMARMPLDVKVFMQNVPVTWDEVQFLDGYPGKSYVVARRAGKQWYVAGINADLESKEISVKLPFIPRNANGKLFYTDKGNIATRTYKMTTSQNLSLTLPPNDGFVLLFE